MKKFYVYFLRRPDKKDPFWPEESQPFYIGKGSNGRKDDHFKEASIALNQPGNNSYKINIIHFLWENNLDFEVDIVFENLTEQEAFELESDAIKAYGRKDNGTGILANLTDGGDGVSGWIATEEYRKNQSLKSRGRKMPDWTKKKISETHKKLPFRPLTQEHKDKISKAMKGRIISEEWRRKLSESNQGVKRSEETKRRVSAAQKGRKLTQEQRQNISRLLMGRLVSEETRRKISESNKRTKAKQRLEREVKI